MSRYSRGADFERRVMKHLEGLGFYVMRSAGSHGLVDLCAMRRHGSHLTLLVQCKRDGNLPAKEWDGLLELAKEVGALPVCAFMPGARGITLAVLHAPHRPRVRNWSEWEPMALKEAA